MKSIYLVNTKATNGNIALNKIKKANYDYIKLDTKKSLESLLKEKTKDGYTQFFICGGDGTINQVVEAYMKLEPKIRNKASFGIVPCGRANDLARMMKIPLNLNKSIYSKSQKKKLIDVVRINSKYFVTGGGLGLPAEVVESLDKKTSKVKNKIFKDFRYYMRVLKKIIMGYPGVSVNGIGSKKIDKKLMFLSVNNQGFIGRRFRLSPNSINDDGLIEICGYTKPKSSLQEFLVLRKVLKGKHIEDEKAIFFQTKSLKITLNSKAKFMGDGEILDEAKEFSIKVIPKAFCIVT